MVLVLKNIGVRGMSEGCVCVGRGGGGWVRGC